MSRFILEISLENDASCIGCPLITSFNGEAIYYCRGMENDVAVRSTKRQTDCPLKPAQLEYKCETCKNFEDAWFCDVCMRNSDNNLEDNWEAKYE